MKKIASFQVNHLKLLPGLYVSRKDNIMINNQVGVITTFDMRITRPNIDTVMDTGSVHAYEHLGATFLRNHHKYQDKIVYFGPMGCRTGFYLIVGYEATSKEIFGLVKEMNEFVLNFIGEIPGANSKDCGNYLDMNLEGAKEFALKYQKEFLDYPKEEQFIY